MEKNKNGKPGACCVSHRCEIMGMVFLAIATVLTLLTFSGVGILGMFLVGAVFCCHKHMGHRKCSCGSNCSCGCCSHDTTMCATPTVKKESSTTKKTTTKK